MINLNKLTALLQKIFPRWIYIQLRPVAAVLLECINWKVETMHVRKVKILAYADPYFPNNELFEEIKGYFRHYVPKRGDIIIDAGAYSGVFTVAAAKLVGPTGKVIAYEPDPFNRMRLQKNIWLNKLTNVVVRPYGLYSRQTTLQFEVRQVASRIAENKESPIDVKMRSLDREVKHLKLTRVHMIKMDIEGAEIEALQGARKMNKTFRSTLHWAIASYHIIKGKPTSQWLEQYFSKAGFHVVTEYPRHKTTYAWVK